MVSLGLVCMKFIQGIYDFGELPGGDVGVDFCGFGACVFQQFLDVAEAYSLFQRWVAKLLSEWCSTTQMHKTLNLNKVLGLFVYRL